MMRSYENRILESSFISSIEFGYKKIKKLLFLNIVTTLLYALLVIAKAFHKNLDILRTVLVAGGETILNSLLLQSWVPIIKVAQSLNGVSWYLSTALFLYILFPVIKRFLSRLNVKKQIVLACVIVFLQFAFSLLTKGVVLWDDSFYIWSVYCFPIYRIGEFVVGAIAYKIYGEFAGRRKRNNSLFEIVLLALAITVVFADKGIISFLPSWINYSILYMILSVMIIIMFIERRGLLTKICDNKACRYIGDISDNMFLIHYVLIYYVVTVCSFIGFGHNIFEKIIIVLVEFVLSAIISIAWKRYFQDKCKLQSEGIKCTPPLIH